MQYDLDPYIDRDFPVVVLEESVASVLERIRQDGLKHKIIYLYVVNQSGELLGVLPIRRLLTSQLASQVASIFIPSIVSLSRSNTLATVKEAFASHKFLAFPVVDENDRFIGVVSIERFAGDLGDVTARQGFDDVYELFGIVADFSAITSPLKRFGRRLPWMLSTVCVGLACAYVTHLFHATLSTSLWLALFLTLVLGLNESISMQTATIVVQSLHRIRPTISSLKSYLGRELVSAGLLALTAGLIAGGVAGVAFQDFRIAITLFVSVLLSMVLSATWGVILPFGLHRVAKDPKVGVGPLVLAFSDTGTLILYFSLAKWLMATD